MTSVLLLLLHVSPPNPFLAEARVHFQAQDFSKCLKRLEQASAWNSSVDEEAEVSLYRGLCRFGVGDERGAAGDFEHALRISPSIALPAWSSPRFRDAFTAARERAGLPVTTTPAPPVVDPAPPTPPLVVATPVSVTPRRLGLIPALVTGSVSAVALGVGIACGIRARALEGESYRATFESDARAAALGARDFATGANASYAVAAMTVLAAGILLVIDLVGAR